jgi:hypothetical protein
LSAATAIPGTRDGIEAWIADVERQLFSALRADARLKDAEVMIARFTANVQRWRAGRPVRTVIEDVNELAAAASILALDNHEVVIRYEPRLMNTRKTIDFQLQWPDGTFSWVDVKTVSPLWTDDEASWHRFERIAARFPDNAQLVVSRAWAGAAISGQAIKSRWSFVRRTIEAQAKVSALDERERGPVRLLLCSNGAFHKDELEDFADFYKRGRFRDDDWARNAVERFMKDEGSTFGRSLAGFCFLERRFDEALASEFVVDVRGPAFWS